MFLTKNGDNGPSSWNKLLNDDAQWMTEWLSWPKNYILHFLKENF